MNQEEKKKADKGLALKVEHASFETLEHMFDGIIQKPLEAIRKEAEKLNDYSVMALIDNALNAPDKCISVIFAIDKSIFKHMDVEEQYEKLYDYTEFGFIVDKIVQEQSARLDINSTSDYMGTCLYTLKYMFDEKNIYSALSYRALRLILESLMLFEHCHSLNNSKTINMYDICSYSLELKDLIEKVSSLSGINNKNFLQNNKERKAKENELFLSEMKLLIIKNNNKILPACKEYYSNNEVKENHEYLKKHQPSKCWKDRAKKSRPEAIRRKYHRLKSDILEKN